VNALNPYRSLGCATTCYQLAAAFYDRAFHDAVLQRFFPGKSHRCAVEAFAAFLAQFLGGPPEDAQHRWYLSLRESHGRFRIGARERDAWMANMIQAMDEVPMDASSRRAFRDLFEQASAYMVNAEDPPALPTPQEHELSDRWRAQTTLDDAVAAVRRGDSDHAIALAERPTLQAYFETSRTALISLIAVMIGTDDGTLQNYVGEKLQADPALATQRYSNRTLLHAAAAAGNLAIAQLLLRLGAPPDIATGGGHTPLYCLANECGAMGGAKVVGALIKAGANVNASDGVKHCTPLHMAARRGNVEIAEALLNHGADLEARDSAGETPLRRAVNCNKAEMAALLVAKGADIHSIGKRGLTPLLAARSPAMKGAIQPPASAI
jgi:truncated hemoglobin YjbI